MEQTTNVYKINIIRFIKKLYIIEEKENSDIFFILFLCCFSFVKLTTRVSILGKIKNKKIFLF